MCHSTKIVSMSAVDIDDGRCVFSFCYGRDHSSKLFLSYKSHQCLLLPLSAFILSHILHLCKRFF